MQCFWFTVEYGLCRQDGEVKAYGAGLLSSFGELEYCLTDQPELHEFEPAKTGEQDYPITKYQPIYFVSDSFESAKEKMMWVQTNDARTEEMINFDLIFFPFLTQKIRKYDSTAIWRALQFLYAEHWSAGFKAANRESHAQFEYGIPDIAQCIQSAPGVNRHDVKHRARKSYQFIMCTIFNLENIYDFWMHDGENLQTINYYLLFTFITSNDIRMIVWHENKNI